MFDCFAAGTVPVYWGAPNVKDYIPSGCFVDVNDFDNYEQLYNYLISMPKGEYQQYLHNVKDYIKTTEYSLFTSKKYAEIVANQINVVLKKSEVARSPVYLKLKLMQLIARHPKLLNSWKLYRQMLIAMVMVW
jgi:hypothetical protein